MTDLIVLALDIEKVNQILAILGNVPYIQVFKLINEIQTQANEQVNKPQVDKPESSDAD